MRSPSIGCNGIGIEVLQRSIQIVQPSTFGPIDKILGGSGLDGANSTERSLLRPARRPDEISVECDVFLAKRIPKAQILRIERPIADHLFFQRFPVQPIDRHQGPEGSSGQGFVTLIWRSIGIGVLEGREVVRPFVYPDDVVGPRALEFVDAQRRARPVDSVAALGITGHLFRLLLCPYAAIVHTKDISVREHGDVSRVLTFPTLVEIHYHFSRLGSVKGQADMIHATDQPVVHEELEAGPYFPDFLLRASSGYASGKGRNGSKKQKDGHPDPS